jgi:hypothetical protein
MVSIPKRIGWQLTLVFLLACVVATVILHRLQTSDEEAKRQNEAKLDEWKRNPPRTKHFPPQATLPNAPPQAIAPNPESFQGLTEADLIMRLGKPLRVETRESPDGPFKFLEFDRAKGNETFFLLFVDDGRVFHGSYRGVPMSLRDDGKPHFLPKQ